MARAARRRHLRGDASFVAAVVARGRPASRCIRARGAGLAAGGVSRKSLRPLDGVVRADLLDAFQEMGRSDAGAGPSGGAGSPRMSSGLRLSRWLGLRHRSGLSGGSPLSTLGVALGAGAVTCLLVLAGWRFFMQPDHRVHQTERGGFERVVLPDGSTASLNTNSEIRVHFTHHHREIVLTRGEALFSVAHDELRPFEVDAGANAVRALGTVLCPSPPRREGGSARPTR